MNELITHIIMGSIYTGTLYYFFIYKNRLNYYLTKHNIPVITENPDNSDNPDNPNNPICALCLSNFKINKTKVIPTCGHLLHIDCYTKLVKSRCPTHKQCPTCRDTFIKERPLINNYSNSASTPTPTRINLPRYYAISDATNNYPTPHPTPHPSPHPSPHPTPHPILHPLFHPRISHPRRNNRPATIYPEEENSSLNTLNTQENRPENTAENRPENTLENQLPQSLYTEDITPTTLRQWNRYTQLQRNHIIDRLFNDTNLEYLLQIKYSNEETIIASAYRLRTWNLHTRREKEIMIRQIFSS